MATITDHDKTPFGRELDVFLAANRNHKYNSRNKIARAAGIAPSDVSRMSNGRARLTLRVLRQVAGVTGWTDTVVGALAMTAADAPAEVTQPEDSLRRFEE